MEKVEDSKRVRKQQEEEVESLLAEETEMREDGHLEKEEEWKQRARELESRIEEAVARAEGRSLQDQRRQRQIQHIQRDFAWW